MGPTVLKQKQNQLYVLKIQYLFVKCMEQLILIHSDAVGVIVKVVRIDEPNTPLTVPPGFMSHSV